MDIVKYKKIVVALRPSLLAVALRIIGNAQDAEDVEQDVCLKIVMNTEKTKAPMPTKRRLVYNFTSDNTKI